ncbi:MAG: 6-phosphogluconate dehydrogenase [Bacteroidetes bacterium]|nr:6-phosphogluconate dehydrogenase [Bacteroidota bacterium]
MENESFGQRLGKVTKKILKRTLILVLVVGALIFSFLYWGVYERGIMAGKVLRITQKGVLFKTYEGKLNLETFGALKGTSPIAESFDFSVESDETEVIKELEQVALSGERVNLHFKKRYTTFFWRGDTRYFIDKVERMK